tara:strand:- start:37909 stop:38496 length:588 start_codon:yes stop_codon:yes gene_type:complete
LNINNILHKNFPNILSFFRIFMTPIIVLLMLEQDIYYRIISFFIILFVSLTDALDGYYARKYNLISDFGKYLDPAADKIFVLSILFALHYILVDYISLWIVLMIFLRDIFVTVLRTVSSKRGFKFKTSRLAKNKTLVQIIAIYIIFLFMILNESNIYIINYSIFYYIMLICLLLSLLSACDYLKQYYFLNKNELD